MFKNKNTKPILLVIMIFSILLILVLGVMYLYLKKDAKNKNQEINGSDTTVSKDDTFMYSLENKLTDMYGYSFYFEVSGENTKYLFPEWFNQLFEIRIGNDVVDKDNTIYIYGTVNKNGSDIGITFANLDGWIDSMGREFSPETVRKYESLYFKGCEDGLYLSNCYNVFTHSHCVYSLDYLTGEGIDKYKYLKCSNNGSGIYINSNLFSMFSDMSRNENIKLGFTEDGKYAFSISNKDYFYENNDFYFSLPSGFSMSYSERETDGTIFYDFVGTGGNLDITGYIRENISYSLPYELNPYWEIVEPSFFLKPVNEYLSN